MPRLAPDGITGQLVTLMLAHAMWMALAAGSLAGSWLWLARKRTPATRYAGLLALLAASVGGPGLVSLAQQSALAPESSRFAITLSKAEPATAKPSALRLDPQTHSTRNPREPGWGRIVLVKMQKCVSVFERFAPWILRCWLVGASVGLVWLATGLLSTARLRRQAVEAPAAVRRQAAVLAERLRMRRSPDVRVHTGLRVPLVFGAARPIVLIPDAWLDGSAGAAVVEAIVAHELAHVKRGDLLVNLAQRFVEVCLFFHPSVHWLSRRIRTERERCADALAVAVTGNPLALALALQSVAQAQHGRGRGLSCVAAVGGGDGSLLPRIQELLGMMPAKSKFRPWSLFALPIAAGLGLAAASLGLAQEPAQRTAAPAGSPAPDPAGKPGLLEVTRFEFQEPYSANSIQVNGEPAPQGADPNRQISFEVRLIERPVEPVELPPNAPPWPGPEVVTSWRPGQPEVRSILEDAQKQPRANVLQAPKVTAFQNAAATISMVKSTHYVKDVRPVWNDQGGVAFQPQIDRIEEGPTLEIKGDYEGDQVHITVRLSDTEIREIREQRREAQAADGKSKLAAVYQTPDLIERDFTGDLSLADGETLAVSLGHYPRQHKRSGLFWNAVGLLEHVGFRSINVQTDTVEKLVLITPRRIILEPEEDRSVRQAGFEAPPAR